MKASNRALVVVVWAALIGPSVAARAAKRGAAAGVARVTYLAKDRVYLDRGAEDGVAIGDLLPLERGDGSRRCKVVELAPNSAVCTGAPARVDDRLRLLRRATEEAQPVAALSPEKQTAATLDAWRAALASSRAPLVDYKGAALAKRSRVTANAAARHLAWAQLNRSATGFHVERLDAGLSSSSVGLNDLGLVARLTALRWTDRPARARYRPAEPTQLYVWEAAAAYRPRGGGPSAAVGRIRPRGVPGLGLLDGAQAGWRRAGARGEVGLYGGGVPEPVTLTPRQDVWTLGAYARQELDIGALVLEPSLRAGVVQLGDGEQRLSSALQARARLTRDMSLTAQARASAPVTALEAAELDGWTVDLSARPHRLVDVYLAARETRAFAELTGDLVDRSGTRRAELTAELSPLSALQLAASAGAVEELGAGRRAYAGPEVRLAEVLPWRGRVALGYLAELGELPGHVVYLHWLGAPSESLRLSSRAAFSWTELAEVLQREASVWLSCDAHLEQWLSVRLSTGAAYGRVGVEAEQLPLGLMGTIGLVAEL